MQYNICPYCGANLDPGERCDCQDENEEDILQIIEHDEESK